MFTATLAGKGEESSSASSASSSASSQPSSLISSPFFSSTFPSFSTSHVTILTMPSKNSNITYQQLNQNSSTITNINEDKPIQDEKKDNLRPQRRLPLPNKLSFEQNITNLIEKESPLLQSELLTAEHELSVLRSRLAVNEGVTAVTGTILESLKEQFESHHKIDRPTSPIEFNLHQQSSSIQTSPSLENLPESLEIHFDAQSPRSPYLIVKAINSFWLAQPLNDSDVDIHMKKFSSPIMKRAKIQLPEDFDDIDKDSISEEDECIIIDRDEQLSEMKTIRSSSLIQQIDSYEQFDDKIEEIFILIDQIKHNKLTDIILNNLKKKFEQLKLIIHNIELTKQDELRIEYEFDELEKFFNENDYHFIELFEQNLNELQHIIIQIKLNEKPIEHSLVSEFENKLQIIENKIKPIQKNRLIPENPIVTKDVFFEGNQIRKTSPSNTIRLIPEDPQINASSFYEGDIHRSFYPHPQFEHEKKVLIPEKPLVSSEVFYEGDPQRSMFIKQRSHLIHYESLPTTSSSSPPPMSIDNLREIMSDLMLAASWSRKPLKLEKQQTNENNIEIHAESFLTTEEEHQSEIIHEIENFSILHPVILIESDNDIIITEKQQEISFDEKLLRQTSDNLVEQILNDVITEEENYLYYQAAVQIVNDILENIYIKDDETSSSSIEISDNEDNHEYLSSSSSSDDEENEKLIPQISDQPYLFVNDVVTSKSTQEIGNLVQELQVLEYKMHDIHNLSSSSSSSSSLSDNHKQNQSLNLSIQPPEINTTKSVTDLNNLVSELQNIEQQLEDKLDSSTIEIPKSPISSKSFNELGGLINELKTVTNRIHEEIFTSNNIDLLSQDIIKYRRDSQPINSENNFSQKSQDEIEIVNEMINKIIQEAQTILLNESLSDPTVKFIPTIVIDQQCKIYHQSSGTSISDDSDLSHEDNINDKTFELAAQLDYLRRMSRYDNLTSDYEQFEIIQKANLSSDEENNNNNLKTNINQQSTDSLDYHSIEDNDSSLSDRINKSTETQQQQQQHFQSAYDLHDEEKSKLVRSPELYNIPNVIKHDQQSLLTNSQIQYRTLSESALTIDDSKYPNISTSNNETSMSKDSSYEYIQQRLPTPFDDVLEKESSPEHSESYNLPITAFSDVYEPTSSCQRPLIFPVSNQQQIPSDNEYEIVANDLVNHVLNDIATELITEQDHSSLSHKNNTSSSSSSSDNDAILEEEEEEEEEEDLNNRKISLRSSFSKVLRRAQTETKDFHIIQSPVLLNPPIIRCNSQSDTETYFHNISPSIDDYIKIENSSSDENSSSKTYNLLNTFNEKYSGEGEESSGCKTDLIQRRKRSNDITLNYESPPVKNVSLKFDLNENYHRQESFDSPTKESNEQFLQNILQETILRTNLETFQIDLKFHNHINKNSYQQTYSTSTTTKKSSSSSYYDYDAESETDRDDFKKVSNNKTIDLNIKNLLDELIDTINENASISSQSDATTVIFNSNKTSLDDEENFDINQIINSSSSNSVISQKEQTLNSTTVNTKKQSSIPLISNHEFLNKKKFRSYPGSLVPLTSISTISTTSLNFPSGGN